MSAIVKSEAQSEAQTTEERFRLLSAAVRERGVRWGLDVPSDPSDDEWSVRLGSIYVVAETLDQALEIALQVLVEGRHDAFLSGARPEPRCAHGVAYEVVDGVRHLHCDDCFGALATGSTGSLGRVPPGNYRLSPDGASA